jgi:hypothetical protein
MYHIQACFIACMLAVACSNACTVSRSSKRNTAKLQVHVVDVDCGAYLHHEQ